MKQKINEQTKELIRAIMLLQTEQEYLDFFEDIFTIKELQDMSQRFLVAKMLNDGEKYQKIEEETGASTATISRVNKCLVYGSGGYQNVLEKLGELK
jgi:TrpR-related protein YerC/YecD